MKVWKEKILVKNHRSPVLPFQCPWLCGRENRGKSLCWIWRWYMNSRCSVSSQTVENSSSNEHPTSIKEKHDLKRKTWGGEAFVQGTAANWNSATAKTITSASWKLGDNLFMLCCFSNLILFPHLEGLISKTWSAGLLCSRTNHCWSVPHLHLLLKCDLLSILLT